jgi:hypothetical protein
LPVVLGTEVLLLLLLVEPVGLDVEAAALLSTASSV